MPSRKVDRRDDADFRYQQVLPRTFPFLFYIRPPVIRGRAEIRVHFQRSRLHRFRLLLSDQNLGVTTKRVLGILTYFRRIASSLYSIGWAHGARFTSFLRRNTCRISNANSLTKFVATADSCLGQHAVMHRLSICCVAPGATRCRASRRRGPAYIGTCGRSSCSVRL